MIMVVGLGNPGEKYQNNRHNIGFKAVDLLQQKLIEESWQMNKKFEAMVAQNKKVIFVKPLTFMNESGRSVSSIMHFYKVKCEDLYVIHDDLDISLGSYKIQFGKGPQIHNGLRSIEEKLGTDQFWNVRVGVENRIVKGNKGIPGVVYSLQNFNKEEEAIIEGVTKKVVEDLMLRAK